MSQTATIPTTATTLGFGLEISACDSPADYLEVLIDGSREFVIDGASPLCGVFGYSSQAIDITGYASGGTHELEFHSQTVSGNRDVSNFCVDDVSIPAKLSEYTDIGTAEPIFSDGFETE